MPRRFAVSLLLAAACSTQQPSAPTPVPAATAVASATAAPVASSPAPPPPAAPSSRLAAATSVAAAPPAPPADPEPTFDEIAHVLYADRADTASATAACSPGMPPDARVRCLFDERYKGDARAASLAHELFVKWRIVAGVEVAHTMNGGYRGMIRLEPALPIGAERKHIEWIVSAMRDFDLFFEELDRFGAPRKDAKRYRFKPLTLRFTRSVAARTPSAYAHDWTVAWNLAGSLHTSPDAVRETLFHEIFHLNDFAHVANVGWSPARLGADFDAIAKKCGTGIPCLAPFTPNETIVRGGTYYSFQPGNGVLEYAAELALRYYREQRAALRSLARPKPFKCGPAENGRSWALMRDEFFGGVDAVPACGS